MTIKKEIILPGAFIVLSLALFHASVTGTTQAQNTYDGREQQEQTRPSVSNQKLESFIAVQDEIKRLETLYKEAAQSGEVPEDGRSLTEAIIEAIEAEGLSVNDYNRILGAVQQTETDISRRYLDMHSER